MDLNNHITHDLLKQWAKELGFQNLGVSDIDLSTQETRLQQWLSNNFHGDMAWMQRHGNMRTRPAELVPETISIISVRMNYRPPQTHDPIMVLNHPEVGYISRYALGRDYHKLMRKQLQKLAKRIEAKIAEQGQDIKEMSYRVFSDSAPVMEKAIAVKAGLGWEGKHTLMLNRNAGSWFFLGEIYTNLPLKKSKPITDHCGSCVACLDICPTKAIIKPYTVDARRCISYMTIENKGAIPEEFREAIGNRIYGCDDCQLICPWNTFAIDTEQTDFSARQGLDAANLLDLFAWTEKEFLQKLEGSSIRRIGHESWQRNIAVALGNAPPSNKIINALEEKRGQSSALVVEHIEWALQRQKASI